MINRRKTTAQSSNTCITANVYRNGKLVSSSTGGKQMVDGPKYVYRSNNKTGIPELVEIQV